MAQSESSSLTEMSVKITELTQESEAGTNAFREKIRSGSDRCLRKISDAMNPSDMDVNQFNIELNQTTSEAFHSPQKTVSSSFLKVTPIIAAFIIITIVGITTGACASIAYAFNLPSHGQNGE